MMAFAKTTLTVHASNIKNRVVSYADAMITASTPIKAANARRSAAKSVCAPQSTRVVDKLALFNATSN